MHTFGISGIISDVGIEEVEEGRNDVSGKAQAGEVGGENISSIKEGPSCRQEAQLNMLVGKNLVEQGRAYLSANNMKLWTGVFEAALAITDVDQAKASSRVKEGHLCQTPPEILY